MTERKAYIYHAGRHGAGNEKTPPRHVRAGLPAFITAGAFSGISLGAYGRFVVSAY